MIRRDPIDPMPGEQTKTEQPQQQAKTVVEKIKTKVAERAMEIDGVAVGPVAARLIRQQQMELIGVQVLRFAIVSRPSGVGAARSSREPFNPTKHADCQVENVVREYLLTQPDSDGHRRVRLVANGVDIGDVGLRLARKCLLKCALTSVGEAMLAEAEPKHPTEALVE